MTERSADLILTSARVWDGTQRVGHDAIAIGNGRIVATGSMRSIVDGLGADETRQIDVAGRTVMPGLIDSHIHMVRSGTTWLQDVHWSGVSSLETALELVALGAARRDPGEWIAVLGGWHPNQFIERRPPTRHELDEAAPHNPVFAQRNYVEAYLNSRALQEMEGRGGGGAEVRDIDPAGGEPSGRVTGGGTLQALRSRLRPPDFEQQIEGLRAVLAKLRGWGVTGAIDAGGFGMTAERYRPLLELWRRGLTGFRIRLLVGAATPGAESEEIQQWMDTVDPGFGDEHLRYLGAGEVLLYEAHDMEGLDHRDISAASDGLAEVSKQLASRNWPAHAHAILNTSVGTVIDAWESIADTAALSDLRYAIAHAEGVSAENLRRIRDLGIGVTIQNGMAFRGRDSVATWGEEAVRGAPPLRTMVDLGIPTGAGTDATVVSSPNPWLCVWWMVSGKSVDGSPPRVDAARLSIDEALRVFTSGSAWFSFEEKDRGNLKPGSHADLVVLSKDPFTIAVDELPTIEADLTMVGGEVVHESGELAVHVLGTGT